MNWKYVYVIHINTEVFPPSCTFRVHEARFGEAGNDGLVKHFDSYGPVENGSNVEFISDLVDWPTPIAVEYQDGHIVWLHEGSRKYHKKKSEGSKTIKQASVAELCKLVMYELANNKGEMK